MVGRDYPVIRASTGRGTREFVSRVPVLTVPISATIYGRGCGLGRGLGVGLSLGVAVGVDVAVAVAVGVGVGVNVAVAVAVAVGVGVGPCGSAQYLPPVLK